MGKRATAIAAGVLCIVSIASAQSVTSGIFGFVKVDKPASTLNIIGNNFGADSTTLNEITSVNHFNGSFLINDADRIIIWNSVSKTYSTYALYDNGSTVEWRSGSDFYGSGVNPSIPAGSAFWVQSLGSTVDTNLVVSGDVVGSQSVTNQISLGLQMLAYPFTTDMDLNETLLAENATGSFLINNADQVIAWDSTSQTYSTYALYDNGTTVEWRSGSDFYNPAGTIEVNLGLGFWYDAKAGFEWVETNKYFYNL